MRRRKAGAGSMATTNCPSSFKVSGSPTGSKSPATPRPRNPKSPPPDPSGHHQDSAIALAIAGELPFRAGTAIEIVEDHPRQSAFGKTPVIVDIHGLHHLYSRPPSCSTSATFKAALRRNSISIGTRWRHPQPIAVGVMGSEDSDRRPIERVAALGKQRQEPVAQEACSGQRHKELRISTSLLVLLDFRGRIHEVPFADNGSSRRAARESR